jgi:hypothetical protein
MLSELMLLCRLYKTRNIGLRHSKIDKLVSFATKTLVRSNYLDRLFRSPELLVIYSDIYHSLWEFGYCLPEFRNAIELVAKDELLMGRIPKIINLMSITYSLDKVGIKHKFPKMIDIYKMSILSKALLPLQLTIEDAYDITHFIFYLSDFGKSDIASFELSKPQIARIRWALNCLMMIYLQEKNWDLLSELLLACSCLEWIPLPIYDLVRDAIVHVQKQDGSLPGVIFPNDEIRPSTNSFLQRYHSTIAFAISCVCTKSIGQATLYFEGNGRQSPNRQSQMLMKVFNWISITYENLQTTELCYNVLMNILLGLWISYSGFGLHAREINFCAKDIQKKFESMSGKGERSSIDANLVLFTALIFKKLNIKSDGVNSYVEKIFRSFQKSYSSTDTNLLQPIYLLYKLHLLKEKDWEVYLDKCSSFNGILKFENKHFIIGNLTSYIEGKSIFGKLTISVDPVLDNKIYFYISSFLLHSLYCYDLKLALNLLRLANYMGKQNCRNSLHSLDFLLKQQRHEGSFGYFPIKQEGNNRDKNLDLDIKMPLAMQAAWVLAEITNPSFRVLHTI